MPSVSTKNPLYETEKILWPSLLEKAWAKVKGGYGEKSAHRDTLLSMGPLGDIIDYHRTNTAQQETL